MPAEPSLMRVLLHPLQSDCSSQALDPDHDVWQVRTWGAAPPGPWDAPPWKQPRWLPLVVPPPAPESEA